jgi:ABC-type Fe3+-hydroxamate transport system substrate-binding protein
MRPAAMLFALAASALALAGCGGGSSQADATTETDTGTETAQATTPATATTETATTTETTTPSAPKPRTITIVVESGRPRGGIARPTVAKGAKIVVIVRADAGEDVHLHGYDIEKPVTPGTPVRIPFTADLPGRFELELHHPDALLAVIEVKP